MLRRNKRIPGKDTVSEIIRKGRGPISEFFNVKMQKNTRNTNRYAIVISKKVHKKACIRNKKRRQIYEILKEIGQSEIYFDIVLLARPSILKLKFEEMRQIINSLIHDRKTTV